MLALPVIAGYYYAVRNSRREEYFIDLNNIFATLGHVFVGIRRYFWKSYWLGFVGLLVPVALLILPAVLWQVTGKPLLYPGLALAILWLPAFFLAGAIVLYGYPYLMARPDGSAVRYALSGARKRPFLTAGIGVLLLFPIPAFVFHLLMVFSYPILVASSLGIAGDMGTPEAIGLGAQEVTLGQLGVAFALAAVMFGITFLLAWLWSGVGLFVGLAVSFFLALLARSKGLL
jgi:hypothetical protein